MPAFDGLNLSFEAREGILKRCPRAVAQTLEAQEPGGVGRRFLDGSQPSLEAQLVNLADEIAYNAHDIDDGVRSGLLDADQLDALPLVRRFRDQALAEHPGLAPAPGRRLLAETLRRMLSAQVYDVIDTTARRLAAGRTGRCRCGAADWGRWCRPRTRCATGRWTSSASCSVRCTATRR